MNSHNIHSTIERCPHDAENPYCMVSNSLIRDESLAPECRWLLIYLLSNKPGWKLNPAQIVAHLTPHKGFKRDRVYRILNELIAAGYMRREQLRKDGSRFNSYAYYVSEKPKFKKMFTETEIPVAEKIFEKEGGKSDFQIISPRRPTSETESADLKKEHVSSLRSDTSKKKNNSLVEEAQDPPDKPGGRERDEKFSPEDLKVAQKFADELQRMMPYSKRPNIQEWAYKIRLMRERDNRTLEQILELIEWAFQDEFWCTVIQSPTSLRKHFDKIWMKKHPPSTKGVTIANNRDCARQVVDYLASIGRGNLIKIYKDNIYNMKTKDSVQFGLPEQTFKEIILKWAELREETE